MTPLERFVKTQKVLTAKEYNEKYFLLEDADADLYLEYTHESGAIGTIEYSAPQPGEDLLPYRVWQDGMEPCFRFLEDAEKFLFENEIEY